MNTNHNIVMKFAMLFWIAMLLVACGGGGGNSGGPGGGGNTLGGDASLSGLSFSTGSLTPGFAAEQTSYSVTVSSAAGGNGGLGRTGGAGGGG